MRRAIGQSSRQSHRINSTRQVDDQLKCGIADELSRQKVIRSDAVLPTEIPVTKTTTIASMALPPTQPPLCP
jgi:hypothetical protein